MQNINENSVKLNYFNIVFYKELKGNSLEEATKYFTEWEKKYVKYFAEDERCIFTGNRIEFRITIYNELENNLLTEKHRYELKTTMQSNSSDCIYLINLSLDESVFSLSNMTYEKEINDEILNKLKAHIRYEIIEYNGKWFVVCLEFIDLHNLKLYKIEDLAFAFKTMLDGIKLEEIKKENEIKEKELIKEKKIEEKNLKQVETKNKLEKHIEELQLEYKRTTENLQGRLLNEFYTTVLDNRRTKLKEYIMVCYSELYFMNKECE